MKFPDKKYSVIYADPPWSYRQHGTGPKSRGNAAQHYHTMSTEDICALPIRQIMRGGGGRAAHEAGIPTANFPFKTMMFINEEDGVVVRDGYGAPPVKI